jgi:hypothetical protein
MRSKFLALASATGLGLLALTGFQSAAQAHEPVFPCRTLRSGSLPRLFVPLPSRPRPPLVGSMGGRFTPGLRNIVNILPNFQEL